MDFITDKQTLDDLNIPGKYRPDSVFSLFNQTVTPGGERLLNDMFQHPLTDHKEINERSSTIQYFTKLDLTFPFSKKQFEIMEEYLAAEGSSNIATAVMHVYRKKILASVVRDDGYDVLHHQIITTIELLNKFVDFLNSIEVLAEGNVFLKQMQSIRALFSTGSQSWLVKLRSLKKLTTAQAVKYDYLLKTVHAQEMKIILEAVYYSDVYIAVANLAKSRGFTFADAQPKKTNLLTVANLRHPCIEKAIGNAVEMNKDGNVIFLTGANMAGKSTFMKSFGIAIYLAHMGFPVAAYDMVFSVKDGIYTSINVPDDLSLGYSHFYAEVQRVKKVAEEICRPLELVILFDELFKGTNVKDAYDATLAITGAFAEKNCCLFIISTHITEAGEELRKSSANLQFVYFPSLLNDNKPVYTYKLQQGISNDRHGMMIIQKEGILKLIGA